MEFLSEYGLFLAKIVTVVIAILFVVGAIVAQSVKGKGGSVNTGNIAIDNLNEQFDEYKRQLQQAVESADAFKKLEKDKKKQLPSTDN